MNGKLLVRPIDHTKKSLNVAPLVGSLLNASEKQKIMARSNNSFGMKSCRSQSNKDVLSTRMSPRELYETRSGECLKPFLKEPGTAIGLKNKYKFTAGACLLVDDTHAVINNEKVNMMHPQLQNVGPDLAKIIEENKSAGTMSASDGSFRNKKLNRDTTAVAQASAFGKQATDVDECDSDQE